MEKEKIERAAIGMLPYSDEECADSNYMLGKNVGFKRGFTAGASTRRGTMKRKYRPRRNLYFARYAVTEKKHTFRCSGRQTAR